MIPGGDPREPTCIIRIRRRYSTGEAAGLLYYVMPYVDGESLRARLARERQLPIGEAVNIAVAVAVRSTTRTRAAHCERDTEVGDQRQTLLEQNVLGFEIAMHHAVPVRVIGAPATATAMFTASPIGSWRSRARRARSDSPRRTA